MPWKDIMYSVAALVIGLLVVLILLNENLSGISIKDALGLRYQLGQPGTGTPETVLKNYNLKETDITGKEIGQWVPCTSSPKTTYLNGKYDSWECSCDTGYHAISCGTNPDPSASKYRDDLLNSIFISDDGMSCEYYTMAGDIFTPTLDQKRLNMVFCANDNYFNPNLPTVHRSGFTQQTSTTSYWTNDTTNNCNFNSENLVWCGVRSDWSLDAYKDDVLANLSLDYTFNPFNPHGCQASILDTSTESGPPNGEKYSMQSSCIHESLPSEFIWYTSTAKSTGAATTFDWIEACPGDSTMISCLSKNDATTGTPMYNFNDFWPHVNDNLKRYQCDVNFDAALGSSNQVTQSVSVLCAQKLFQWSPWTKNNPNNPEDCWGSNPPCSGVGGGATDATALAAVNCPSGTTSISCATETDDSMDNGANYFDEDGIGYMDAMWGTPSNCTVYGVDAVGGNEQRRRTGAFCTQDPQTDFVEVWTPNATEIAIPAQASNPWMTCVPDSAGGCNDAGGRHVLYKDWGSGWPVVKWQSNDCPTGYSPVFCGFEEPQSSFADMRDDILLEVNATDKACQITLEDRNTGNGVGGVNTIEAKLHTICAPSNRVQIIPPQGNPDGTYLDVTQANERNPEKWKTPTCSNGILTQTLAETIIDSNPTLYREDPITNTFTDRTLKGGVVGTRDNIGGNEQKRKIGAICLTGTPEGTALGTG